MIASEPGNDLVSFHFSRLTYPFMFLRGFTGLGRSRRDFVFRQQHIPGFVEHASSGALLVLFTLFTLFTLLTLLTLFTLLPLFQLFTLFTQFVKHYFASMSVFLTSV